MLRNIPRVKEQLKINVELAAPDQFIPALPGWEDRSLFIQQERKLSFYHYDFYAQALAKIERGHGIDLRDVDRMLTSGLVQPSGCSNCLPRSRIRFTAIQLSIELPFGEQSSR